MKKLLVLIVILGVLLVAGDAWARGRVEGRLASTLRGSLGRTGDIEVSLGGFPFVLRALSGNIPTATIATERLTRDGLRFTDVTMTLRDIRFSLGKVLAGDLDAIKIGNGEGRAVIDPEVLGRAIARSRDDIEVEIDDDVMRVTAAGRFGLADVSLTRNRLMISVEELGQGFIVPFPRVVAGIQYESVLVANSHLELAFSLDDVRLTGL